MHVFNKERSRFSWTRLLRKFAVHQTYRWETYRKIVRSDSKIGNLRSVRNKLGNFSVWKAVRGERRRSNYFLESKSIRLLRLCVVSWESPPVPWIKRRMERQIEMFMDSKQYRELDRISGEPMEFEWMIFQGFTTLQVLFEIQKINDGLGLRARTIPRKNHSCRCTAASYGEIRKTNEYVLLTPPLWLSVQRSSLGVIGHSWDQGQKRNVMRQTLSGLEENGTESLSSWWLTSVRVGIPHFVQQVRWNEELWKVKEVERHP